MNSRNKKNNLYMAIAGEGMVIWIALKIAPYAKGGLFGILNNFGTALSGNPFRFTIVPETDTSYYVRIVSVCCSLSFFYNEE